MLAALAVRWQTSWANSRVSRASLGWAISASVCATRWSESKLRNGDCSSCADSPCRSVPSKTGSPVGRQCARRHFVQHCSSREQISPRIQLFRPGLLL